MSDQHEDLDPQGDVLAPAISQGNVIEELEESIRLAAAQFLEVGAADLRVFSSRLSAQLISAQVLNDKDLVASVGRQWRLLAEVQRIRFTDAAWETFFSVVDQTSRIAVRVATNFLLHSAAVVAPRSHDADTH